MSRFPSARAFAKWALDGDRLPLSPRPDLMRHGEYGVELVVFRDSCWQIMLVSVAPGAVVPEHRHLRVDSWELGLGGGGHVRIEGRTIDHCPETLAVRGPLSAHLIHVPKLAWHGGQAGKDGGAWLSFQRWDGEPGFFQDDWESR